MYRKLITAACLVAISTSVAAAQNVGLAPSSTALIGFGSSANGGLTGAGQVFTAGAGQNYLTSFSFFLANDTDTDPSSVGSDVQFRGYVYAFDGSSTTGSALYTSGIMSGSNSSTFDQYLFSTGFTPLVPGDMYIAFLSTSGVTQSGFGFNQFALTDDTYSGGNMVLDFGDSNFTDPNSTYDMGRPMAFNAAFATTTPEPSELALLATGLIGLVPMARRKLRV